MYHHNTSMVDVINFPRPIRWQNLRADEAERIIHEWAKQSENVIITDHAFDRVEDRSIVETDVRKILRNGHVIEAPTKTEEGDWKVVISLRMRGTREASLARKP